MLRTLGLGLLWTRGSIFISPMPLSWPRAQRGLVMAVVTRESVTTTVLGLTLFWTEGILITVLGVCLRLTQGSIVAHLGPSPVLVFVVALLPPQSLSRTTNERRRVVGGSCT